MEYQKNALRAVIRRFSSGLGIKSLDDYQINFKRFPVARESKKEAIRYTVKNRGKGGRKTHQKQGKKRLRTCNRGPIRTIDSAIGIKYHASN